MEFPEIGHVGYMVDSADACAEQLGKVWGIDNFVVYDFVPSRCWAYGEEIFDCKLRIALGTPAVGAKVELVEYVSGTNLVMGNFLREKGGFGALWKQRKFNTVTSVFELVAPRLPKPLFRLAIRLIQKGVL